MKNIKEGFVSKNIDIENVFGWPNGNLSFRNAIRKEDDGYWHESQRPLKKVRVTIEFVED